MQTIGKLQVFNFCDYIQNYSADISATMYPLVAVLYLKQMEGYPLSSHMKKTAVASVQAESRKHCKLANWVCRKV